MKVSVVITVYNLEKYIEEAIRSALCQTYPAYEVIIVDDCSTDNSAFCINKFKDVITYIKMAENSGVLMATLEGIKRSTGDIVAFLDGDDIWMPTKLEETVRVFQENEKVILVTHNYDIIDGEGYLIEKSDLTKKNIALITKDQPDIELLSARVKNSILGYRGMWLGSAYCIRRTAFNQIEFDVFMDSFDIPNFRRMCYQDHLIAQYTILTNHSQAQVFLIDKRLFKYRLYGANSSGVSNTVESALSTIKRGSANVLATSTLVSRFDVSDDIKRRQRYMQLEYEYLKALYSKKYLVAIKLFRKLMRSTWTKDQKGKEIKRLSAVLLLGPSKFLALKSK
ncbi:glycosyltransferase family 2 protein [Niabella drilacis]|uniref:glycosyltransferase family 2 protein n=1 Tax=Niabella drilacis (strain DSM 25811 / CCM 8410 / CCUG 62505 / LMG 26954 / E90) TaxID=1285928 RepID=UPI0015A21F0B|nr:glycosyltransferase [Niabella drilacis]